MKQTAILREALNNARAKGVVVTRGGSTFDWVGAKNGVPVSCDVTGAVLLLMGRRLEPGWLTAFCEYLDVDTFWLWRFWMGWDRGYQVQTWDDKEKVWLNDEVSHEARRLAKELL